jgi:5-(carboxyamino)imidazole ribonucleotide synthase
MSESFVGVLGGGQLGRMLALAGYPLGLRFRFLEPSPDAPVSNLAEHYIGDYHDVTVLDRFAEGLSVITYEFENVPVDAAQRLARLVPVFPAPQALAVSQDRLDEKSFLRRCGIPTADFVAIDSLDGLRTAIMRTGLPVVLKTRRMGYDGKGQVVLRSLDELDAAWSKLGGSSLILEQYVGFDRELSMLAVRSRSGDITHYPLVHNWHREGILRKSIPLAIDGSVEDYQLENTAVSYAIKILTELDYVGVLALELFEVNGRLLVNEMAPRVHNSGHWTIEGSVTSQFENHLRAILGMPLGSTRTIGYPAMINLIGSIPDERSVLRVADAHLHVYGKAPRANRKLGHITIQAKTAIERDEQITAIEQILIQ